MKVGTGETNMLFLKFKSYMSLLVDGAGGQHVSKFGDVIMHI